MDGDFAGCLPVRVEDAPAPAAHPPGRVTPGREIPRRLCARLVDTAPIVAPDKTPEPEGRGPGKSLFPALRRHAARQWTAATVLI
jgi:hypothetical protein